MKRLFSLLLAVAMLLTMMPQVAVFASEEQTNAAETPAAPQAEYEILSSGSKTIQQDEENGTYYYSIVPEDHGLYTIQTTGELDTRAQLTDDSGAVVTDSNRSEDGENFAMQVYLEKGRVYDLEVDAAGMGSFDLYLDWTPVSPVTAGGQKVNRVGVSQTVYVPFIAPEDGVYVFGSAAEYDTYGYLYTQDMVLLSEDDDGGEDMNFRINRTMAKGEVVIIGARFYDGAASGTLTVKAGVVDIASVVCHEIMIPEMGSGWFSGGQDSSYYYYEWLSHMTYEVTSKSGEVFTFTGRDFTINGMGYSTQMVTDTQNGSNPWTAGNTYEETVNVGGIECPVKITITESPVVSVEVAPQSVYQHTNGYYNEVYDAQTQGNQPDKYIYSWHNALQYTVTFRDGTVQECTGTTFLYDGQWYDIVRDTNNSGNMPEWEIGTHQGVFYVLGCEATVDVNVLESPVAAVSGGNISLGKESCGRWESGRDSEDNWCEYYHYSWDQYLDCTVILKDGTTLQMDNGNLHYNGDNYSAEEITRQTYMTRWELGTHAATAEIMGFRFPVTVDIKESMVSRVEIEPIEIMSGTGYEDKDAEGNVFVKYNWADLLRYRVEMLNGDVVESSGTAFSHNGKEYVFNTEDDQSYTNQWQEGNTYYVSVELDQVYVSVPVRITESPIASIVASPLSITEKTCGQFLKDGSGEAYYFYDWHYNINYTVYMKNGDVVNASGISFYYQDMEYYIKAWDTQDEHHWLPDGNYTGYISVCGYDTPVSVQITENPVASLSFQPLRLMQEDGGFWEEDNAWFYYQWWNSLTYTVTFTDGSTETFTGMVFSHNGQSFELGTSDNQYGEHWLPGGAYETYVYFMGNGYTIPVSIVPSEVVNIQPQVLTLPAGSCGTLKRNGNQLYFDYDWEKYITYTVTFADGNAVEFTGDTFSYNGITYKLTVNDDQESSHWQAGSSHDVSISVPGCGVTASVNISMAQAGTALYPNFQVDQDNQVNIENSGDLEVFSFMPEQSGRYTFVSYSETDEDTYGYLLDSNFNVLMNNDDGAGNLQFRVEAYLNAGEVYYIAARFLGDQPGSFVVRMLKSVGIESVAFDPLTIYQGSGGNWVAEGPGSAEYYRYYWWDRVSYTVNFTDGGSMRMSGGGGFHYQDAYFDPGWLDEQSGMTPWTPGQHTGYMEVNGTRYPVTIILEETNVASVQLQPVTVLENGGGWMNSYWDEKLQENVNFFQYYWWNELNYVITFKNGDTVSGTGSGYHYDGQYTNFECSDTQYGAPWKGGATYNCYVTVGGQRYQVPVYVMPVHVESVAVEPVVLMENTNGSYQHSQNGEYYHYSWWYQMKMTITLTDGTVIKGNGTNFSYNGYSINVNYRDGQNYENRFLTGNTYYPTICVLGYETQVQVSITDSVGGQAGDNATWTLDSQGTMTISGFGTLYQYNSSESMPWVSYRDKITSVVVSEGITDLPQFAFYGCSSLTSVDIADSVINLSMYAFYSCVNLRDLDLGNGVEEIGHNCFAYCTNLETLTLPTSLRRMGDWAFYPCSDLNRIIYLGTAAALQKVAFDGYVGFERWQVECVGVAQILEEGTAGDLSWNVDSDGKLTITGEGVIPDYTAENPAPWAGYNQFVSFVDIAQTVTTIGDYAFYDFDAMLSVNYPGITAIGDYAFYDCDSITGFPCRGVLTIGDYAFYGADTLFYTAFDRDLVSIGAYAFTETDLTEMEYDGPGYQFYQHNIGEGNDDLMNAYIYSYEEGGVVRSGRCGEGVYWMLREDGELSVWGEGEIFSYTHSEAPWNRVGYPIFSIVIEEGITAIGADAFMHQGNVRELVLPGTLKTIGDDAFMDLANCKVVNIPEGVEYIGNNAFAFSGMEELNLPSTLKHIGFEAFRQCDCLVQVMIPENVEFIAQRAFMACHAMEAIWVHSDNAYYSCDANGVLFNKDQTVLVAAPSFLSDSYTVPATVNTIADFAFAHCTNLQEVIMGDNVTEIGVFAFTGCYALNSVVFGSGVTVLRNGVFMEAGLEEFVIPEGITTIGASAFKGCEHLTKVVIPETVTEIGEYAFANCWNLTDVTLPASISVLGQYAFYQCDMLQQITIPEGVTAIGEFAFADCMELTTVVLPETVENIGAYAFIGCTNLTQVNMSDNVTSIGDSAFEGCVALKEVNIPAGVTELVYRMFAGCTSLENITIPENIQSIGDMVFADCNTLTEVTVPDSVESIGDFAFKQCENLSVVNIGKNVSHLGGGVFNDSPMISAIHVHEENKFYFSDSYGALYEGTMLLRCPPKLQGEFAVAEGTEEFWETAFTDCTELTSITIPGTVSFIPGFTFYGCHNLATVNIQEGVAGIGQAAFANCGALETLVLPDTVNYIEPEAFRDCYNLKSVTLSAGLTDLLDYTFAYCGSLTEVVIPDSITTIWYGAFEGCPIENVYYGGTRAEWMRMNIHGGNNNLHVANISYAGDNEVIASGMCGENLIWTLTAGGKLTVEGEGAMMYYGMFAAEWMEHVNSIREVELCEGVTSVGGAAFMGCYNLEKVTIPSTVSEIEHSAFQDCESLREINLANGVTSIGNCAFTGCAMESVGLPETLVYLADQAFSRCNNLTSIVIPAATTTIEGNPFYGCERLNAIFVAADNTAYMNDECCVVYSKDGTELKFAPGDIRGVYYVMDTTVSIAADAFTSCDSLQILYLPESLTNIGYYAFMGCHALTDVYYAGSETSWNRDVTVEDGNDGIYNAQLHFAKVSNLGEGACGENAIWTLSPEGVLTVSGSGAMFTDLPWDNEVPWHHLRDQINTVIIEEGITTIGSYAFMGCRNLTQVNLATTVRMIDIHAFYDCDSLESIDLPDSMMIIGRSAFENSDNLRYVYGGAGLTQIQSYAFKYCGELVGFYFQNNLRFIGSEAFLGTGLTSVCLPTSMESMENAAFAGCERLKEVTIESSNITELYNGTFKNCVALEYVTLGDSIVKLQDEVFYGCSALQGVVMSYDMNFIGANCFAECKALYAMSIPVGVKEIADNTFYNCENLTYVTMGEVESIGSYAFYNTAITALYTSEALHTIHVGAFAGCRNLNHVALYDGLTTIGSNAFQDCSALTYFAIPAGISCISPYTFANCYNLTTLDVSTNLNTVNEYAFYGCDALATVNYAGNINQWDDIWVDAGNEKLLEAEINCAEQPENYYYCPHCMSEVAFDDWTGVGQSGHYRLTGDYFGSATSIGSSTDAALDVVLDLNGYGLYADGRAFTVYKDNCLTVIDSVGSGVISGGSSSAIGGAVLVSGGVFTMYGGTMTTNSNNSGGCVYVTNSGSFFMNGGQLIGGHLANGRRGGALYVGDYCYAEIQAGVITDGYARGNSIYASAYSSMTIGSATIGELLAGPSVSIYLTGRPVVEAMDLTAGSKLSFEYLTAGTRITVYADDCFTNHVTNAEQYLDYFIPGFEGTAIEAQDGYLYVTYPFEEEVIDLTVLESPYKTVYEQGEELDLNGLVLLAYYASGCEELVDADFTAYGFDSETAGLKEIFVEYNGVTTSFLVRVNEKRVMNVQLHAGPKITEYFVGEYVDTNGIVLEVTYSNGDVDFVADGYQLSIYQLNEVGEQIVTVIYEDYYVDFTVTVKSREVEILQQPISAVVNENDFVAFHVEANNVVTYRWQVDKHDGKGFYNTTLGGYRTDTLSFQATLVRSGYSIRCALTDMDGKVTYTDEVTLEIIPNIITVTQLYITQMPEKLVYNMGEELDLTGLALGASFSYGPDRVIDSGYTVTGFDSAVFGEQTVTITYEGATAQFNVTVLAPEGEITEQPVDANAISGENVSFTVGVKGEVVSYQWQYSTGDGNWFNTTMSSSNTATLSLNASGTRNNYLYRCVVTFANGKVETSAEAKLTVTTVISITGNPNDQVIVLGYSGQFTVAAEGEGLKYQWQYKRPDGERWMDTTMEGADRPTVYIETTKARDGYQYRCCVTDITGNVVYSEPATMTVLSYVKQPVDAYAPVNGSVQFTVEASAESGFTYQWQYRRNASGSWTNTTMTGYNTATLTVGATKARNGYQYRCVLTGAKNSKLESDAVTLYVSEPVQITQQPADVTVSAGQTATFTVVATNVRSYQWYYQRPTGSTWSKTTADGNATETLNVGAKSSNNGYKYRCVIQGMDGQEYITDIATLTVK